MIDRELLALYERLAGTGLASMVVGAVAAARYGEPRSTLDIDLVVGAGPADAERIAAAFAYERFYAPPIAVMRRELGRGSHGSFNIIDSSTGLKASIPRAWTGSWRTDSRTDASTASMASTSRSRRPRTSSR